MSKLFSKVNFIVKFGRVVREFCKIKIIFVFEKENIFENLFCNRFMKIVFIFICKFLCFIFIVMYIFIVCKSLVKYGICYEVLR